MFIDLSGQKFGRLTVIERAESKTKDVKWLCCCECGKTCIVQGNNLKNGHTKSCGCYNSEQTIARNYKHGKRRTSLYNKWSLVRRRCYDPNNPKYKDYGGRGIKVCDRWRESFEAFYEDVSKLPNFEKEGYTLNRIDNDGDYEPNNVEWADDVTQANNRRSNRFYTYNGKTQTIAQWAREYNISYEKLRQRLVYHNWTIEKSLNTP